MKKGYLFMAADSQTYITSKEFLTYMDGFRKEIATSISRIDDSFRNFELGTVTRLNAEVATLKASHEVLKTQMAADKNIEIATYGPTQKIVNRVIDIIISAVVVALLGLVLINTKVIKM